jgi:hypothetical protein
MSVEFGTSWGAMRLPVRARVTIIDPDLMPMIGLSAMQLTNLSLERKEAPPTKEKLYLMVENNRAGYPDTVAYPSVTASGIVEFELKVYNAFGLLCVKDGGVRLSKGAAERLGVKEGDWFTIVATGC